jgi:hypothetical protein
MSTFEENSAPATKRSFAEVARLASNVPKFTGDVELPVHERVSFATWKFHLTQALRFLDATAALLDTKPDVGIIATIDDGHAHYVIVNSIHSSLTPFVVNTTDAWSAYDAIRKQFGRRSNIEAIGLIGGLFALQQGPTESAATWGTTVSDHVAKLRETGVGITIELLHAAVLLLHADPARFETLQAVADDKTIATPNDVVAALRKEEQRRTDQAQLNRGYGQMAATSSTPLSNLSGRSSQRRGDRDLRYPCTHCKAMGYHGAVNHSTSRCWELHAAIRPEGWVSKGAGAIARTATVPPAATQSVSNYHARCSYAYAFASRSFALRVATLIALVLDGGATEHMTPANDCFVPGTYVPFRPARRIYLGDDRWVPALGCGDVLYRSHVDGRMHELTLQRVWHAPQLAVTLISVPRLDQVGYRVTTFGGFTSMYLEGQEVAQAVLSQRGYELTGKLLVHMKQAIASVAATEATWHARFMHLNRRDVRRAASLVNGLEISSTKGGIDDFCNACSLGKAKRLPFPASASKPEIMELLVADLVGAPQDVAGFDGSLYSLIMTEAHSRFPMAKTLKRKSEAAPWVQKTILWLETQTGRRLKNFRSDGGGEFFGKAFTDWCAAKGIKTQITFPDSSASNGIAERQNRTLGEAASSAIVALELAKLFRERSTLPLRLWPYALLAAVHTRGISPDSHDGLMTPHERLFGKRPSVAPADVGLRGDGFCAEAEASRPLRPQGHPMHLRGLHRGAQRLDFRRQGQLTRPARVSRRRVPRGPSCLCPQ